jgi:hypothetical protein
MTRLVSEATCARVKLLCSVHPDRTVAELVGISRNTIYHLKKRQWRALTSFRRCRPRPSDFAIQRNYMDRDGLVKHYRASARTVARWLRETPR